jgi:N-acetylmuramate 1-kinase
LTEHLTPALTPAQQQFLAAHVCGYVEGKWSVTLAGVAGSDRRFLRIAAPTENASPERSYVLILWDSHDQDWPRFAGLVDELGERCPALPRVCARDERHGLVLEEDLGTHTLHRACVGESQETIAGYYRQVLEALIDWQAIDSTISPTIRGRALDEEVFLWESEYFARHCVTEFFGCERCLNETWERERRALAAQAGALTRVCVHRDFQSENVMLHNGRVRFVDFQGARLGPAAYDLASLLYDPYADYLQDSTVAGLFDWYAERSPHNNLRALAMCATQRLMQALGAYGNLSIHKGKERYRAFVPLALRRLRSVLEGCGEFPAIRSVVAACADALQ